ncbi:purine-cytosine permease family protein [Aestuariimicrobium kwangyangense]|uniref:purine-cytosine permease family protein n=1 Tax=Aestuariimicrobium kwangyangense TaxID=396389 RepID=UPI0003B50E96|nr:cytosine permease [Aestuariimicrobium kwangyangense]
MSDSAVKQGPSKQGPDRPTASGENPGAPTGASERRGLIELQGIDVIDEPARTARPRDLFMPWFAANVSVFGMSYGSFVLGFGISFWQATVVSLVGVVFSFLICGIIAIAGKRGSVPTMVLSRAAFGVDGQKLPGALGWLTSIGWETTLTILATLATVTIFDKVGWAHGTAVKILATVVIAGTIVAASVLGYHVIMKLQSVLTWVTGIATVIIMAITVPKIDWAAVSSLPAGSAAQMVGALVMVMTGFGLGWTNVAADWSRYQRRSASSGSIVFWNTFGGSVAPIVLVIFGLLLSVSNKDYAGHVAGDPIGALADLLPTWILLPFLLVAVLSLISGAVLGIYSSGLTLLSLGVKVSRPVAALIDGSILTAGTIFVVFFATDFLGPFQSFLITLGVPLAAWAGIFCSDLALRRRAYDTVSLFKPNGRYGRFDWVSIITLVVSSVIGWGLVVNQFAADASWNNWQGYLLEPLGLGARVVDDQGVQSWDGSWPWANLGVLVSLVISFLVTLVARRGLVRRQESTQTEADENATSADITAELEAGERR